MCTSVTHTDTLRDTVYCVVNEKSMRSELIGDITNLVRNIQSVIIFCEY